MATSRPHPKAFSPYRRYIPQHAPGKGSGKRVERFSPFHAFGATITDEQQIAEDLKLRRRIDDDQRVATLRQYDILDTAAEPEYDRVAEILKTTCGMSKTAITLVDADRQWFKAQQGLHVSQTSRSSSFCSVAMHLGQPLVVDDTHRDRRFARNILVTGEPHIRFYAGAALVSSEGFPLGAVCLIDTKPHTLLPWQLQLLSSARDWVQASLEVRRLSRRLARDRANNEVDLDKIERWRAFAQHRADRTLALFTELHARRRRKITAP